jgi:nucleoside-diphosphate-sugar epimerase
MTVIGITGGTGYVGTRLTQELVAQGYQVRVIDQAASAHPLFSHSQVSYLRGDVTKDQDLEAFLEGVKFVFHLAAISQVPICSREIQRCVELNLLSTRLILERLTALGGGMYFSSSVAALYGTPRYLPVDETHPIQPINDYGVLKRGSELFCEAYHRSRGLFTVIGRQSVVYGPSPAMKYDSVIHAFLRNILQGKDLEIQGSGLQYRNFVFLEDLIQGNLKVLKQFEQGAMIGGEAINLAGPENLTIKELAETVQSLAREEYGREIQVRFAAGRQEAAAPEFRVSIDKAKTLLGHEPATSLAAGLKKTAAYIKEELERGSD